MARPTGDEIRRMEMAMAASPEASAAILRKVWEVGDAEIRAIILENPSCPSELKSVEDELEIPDEAFYSENLAWMLVHEPGEYELGGHALQLSAGRYGNYAPKGYSGYGGTPKHARSMFGSTIVPCFYNQARPHHRASAHGGFYVLDNGLMVCGNDCGVGDQYIGTAQTYFLFVPPEDVQLEWTEKPKFFGSGAKKVDASLVVDVDEETLEVALGGMIGSEVAEAISATEAMLRESGLVALLEDVGNNRKRLSGAAE